MAKKRNRITASMSQTIAESSPLIKKVKTQDANPDNDIREIKISELKENPFQPRIDINLHSLEELITSIEQNGLLQPIVVTKLEGNDDYTIIAGHRRYEAYKIMGEKQIKCSVLKNITDKDLAVLSLTENIMRENLHPIENAIAIKNILDKKIVESQNKLAIYVGMSKGYVSKLMNILKLPSSVIKIIKEENYKDINILILINKLKNEEEMLKAYHQIKDMARSKAAAFIKAQYINIKSVKVDMIDIKRSKSKINIAIDIKHLKEKEKEALNKELEALYKKWN